MNSATETIRAMLDERGVEWVASGTDTCWTGADGYPMRAWETTNGTHMRVADLTPAQAVEATLGRGTWVNPAWERWHKSLRHDEIKSIGDAVEQLMYEVIEFGGDMGPNGNTYNGIDEGDVLTVGFINEWVERFEATLGRGTCHETIIDHHWRGCCSCGYIWEFMYGIGKCERPHYCPNCGAKVVDA